MARSKTLAILLVLRILATPAHRKDVFFILLFFCYVPDSCYVWRIFAYVSYDRQLDLFWCDSDGNLSFRVNGRVSQMNFNK